MPSDSEGEELDWQCASESRQPINKGAISGVLIQEFMCIFLNGKFRRCVGQRYKVAESDATLIISITYLSYGGKDLCEFGASSSSTWVVLWLEVESEES